MRFSVSRHYARGWCLRSVFYLVREWARHLFLSGHSIILAVEMLWLDSFFRALSEVVSRFVPKSDLFCVFLGCGLDLFERGASISCYRLVSSLVNHSEPRLAAAASRVEEPAPRFSRSRLSHEAQAVKGLCSGAWCSQAKRIDGPAPRQRQPLHRRALPLLRWPLRGSQ